jgi:hypothetical protein
MKVPLYLSRFCALCSVAARSGGNDSLRRAEAVRPSARRFCNASVEFDVKNMKPDLSLAHRRARRQQSRLDIAARFRDAHDLVQRAPSLPGRDRQEADAATQRLEKRSAS